MLQSISLVELQEQLLLLLCCSPHHLKSPLQLQIELLQLVLQRLLLSASQRLLQGPRQQ